MFKQGMLLQLPVFLDINFAERKAFEGKLFKWKIFLPSGKLRKKTMDIKTRDKKSLNLERKTGGRKPWAE